jgi:yeast amino acid transporter
MTFSSNHKSLPFPPQKTDTMSTKEYYKRGQAEADIPEAAAPKERNIWARICHSFRRKDAGHELALGEADLVREAGDLSRLNRKLKTRHLQMIAIGGSIGCGLFITSGSALKTGGPGAVILDFCIIGLMMFCTVNAMGELATLFPVQGNASANFAYG